MHTDMNLSKISGLAGEKNENFAIVLSKILLTEELFLINSRIEWHSILYLSKEHNLLSVDIKRDSLFIKICMYN